MKKTKRLKEITAWLLGFWAFKVIIAILTLGAMGCMISYTVVGLWNVMLRAIPIESLCNFFCSSIVTPEINLSENLVQLAIDYIRVGFLETPIVILSSIYATSIEDAV